MMQRALGDRAMRKEMALGLEETMELIALVLLTRDYAQQELFLPTATEFPTIT